MDLNVVEAAAADFAVGADMLADHRYKRTGFDRWITGMALVGSAAAGDMKVEIYVGSSSVAELYNDKTGLGVNKDSVLTYRIAVRAGQVISAVVRDASGTNPGRLLVQTVP